jgi:hypothetical protein
MQNSGKTFVGWNSEPDGSGTWYAAGEQVTLSQLNLGDRDQYAQDLQQLADDQTEEAPAYYDESADTDTSRADEIEAELESKYTANLYAQWESPNAQPAARTTTRRQLPRTADPQSMPQLGALVLAAVASLLAARRLRKS